MKNNLLITFLLTFFVPGLFCGVAQSAPPPVPGLQGGAAAVDITDYTAQPVHDPLYAKALVLRDAEKTLVLITLDVVAIGELGRIKNSFLPEVRAKLREEFNILPEHVLITASHCHGLAASNTPALTIEAVRKAMQQLVPVIVGAGRGSESTISENRRLQLVNGAESDVRRAYPLVPDKAVVGSGEIDPEIGLLRIDRQDGGTLAVLYNFACHPIMGVPGGGNSADFPGFASRTIEAGMGEGSIAFFLQGCTGDINPILYKQSALPPDAVSAGNQLGISALQALKKIKPRSVAAIQIINDTLLLPRATDIAGRIEKLEHKQQQLLHSLKGCNLSLKTFVPMYVRYALDKTHPSYYSYGYTQAQQAGGSALAKLDAENRNAMDRYIYNVETMEELIRIQENIRLLKNHLVRNQSANESTVKAEITLLRINDFTLITFPGEPSVEVGLNIKKSVSGTFTFVAGYTNGYLYYAPTVKQRHNTGYAQEDCECFLAPEWQALYEGRVQELLNQF